MVKRNQISETQQQQQESTIEEQCKSLIKKLASCKQTIRDRSLRKVLLTWLPEQIEISDEDMKKLWQGLFYCIWHADKSLYQSDLIDRLSSALKSLPLHLSTHYFTVFLFTMRREWSRIDRLRLDKFYLLIRKFLHGFFSILDNNSWDLDLTRSLIRVLFDEFEGNGVNYQIASAFLDELRPFLPLRKEVLEILFDPFVRVLGVVSDKVLVGKVKSNVFGELLKMGKKLLECDDDDGVVVLGSIALSMEFAKKFYEMGSSPDCLQGNRKSIFALHNEFLQLEKDLSSSGIKVSIFCPNEDEVVPELVLVSGEAEADKSNAVSKPEDTVVANGCSSKKKKGLKKCSKAKKGGTKKDTDVSGLGDETLISDLRMTSEMGPSNDEVASACEEAEPVLISRKNKKRKRESKGVEEQGASTVNIDVTAETSLTTKSGEKSSKRVRFEMKNNLVWTPHCPLPPQELRVPPSAAPRGSAMKKGVAAGPVKKQLLPSQSRKTKKKKVKPNARKGVRKIIS